ncbi:hypothetical protein V6N13_014113 [Hibiscus sabdariffa]|uniref:Uncharacterized protein n=1 Tax=Hibiscus sabdariffa TaxID=183260 RepID=A0ABR2RUA8_9ROSI
MVQNLPGVAGLATELPGAGLRSTASGFLEQASSNPIAGYQVKSDFQHAGAASSVATFKQASSVATSVGQIASGAAGSDATDVRHTELISSLIGFINQILSVAILAVQKAPGLTHCLATAGVGSTATEFITQLVSGHIAVTQSSPEVQHPIVASVVIPTAAFFTEIYNKTVATGAEKGYKVALFLPLVPIEKIAKVFSEVKSD